MFLISLLPVGIVWQSPVGSKPKAPRIVNLNSNFKESLPYSYPKLKVRVTVESFPYSYPKLKMRVTVGDSGLCCCVCVTGSFEFWLTPLCVDPWRRNKTKCGCPVPVARRSDRETRWFDRDGDGDFISHFLRRRDRSMLLPRCGRSVREDGS